MRLVTSIPPNATVARQYGPNVLLAQIESDVELATACGRGAIVCTAGGYTLYLEQTDEDATAAIARENHPHQIEPRASTLDGIRPDVETENDGDTPGEQRAQLFVNRVLADQDAALEPRDPGARRRDRAPLPPADSPHAFDARVDA